METLTKTIQELYANENFREEYQLWMTKDNMPEDVRSRLEEIIIRSDSSECDSIDRVENIRLMIMPDEEESWCICLDFDVIGRQYTISTRCHATYTDPAEYDVDTDSYKEWVDVEYKISEKTGTPITLDELLTEIDDSEIIKDAMREFTRDIDGDEEDY